MSRKHVQNQTTTDCEKKTKLVKLRGGADWRQLDRLMRKMPKFDDDASYAAFVMAKAWFRAEGFILDFDARSRLFNRLMRRLYQDDSMANSVLSCHGCGQDVRVRSKTFQRLRAQDKLPFCKKKKCQQVRRDLAVRQPNQATDTAQVTPAGSGSRCDR